MFIPLKHKSLNVYASIRELVKETYKVSLLLPREERFNMMQQIRRAALSVQLNFAEGSTRKPETERKDSLKFPVVPLSKYMQAWKQLLI